MNKNLLIALLLALSTICVAQQPQEVYKKPLKDVLSEVEKTYHVELNYNEKDVTGLSVNYATWRFTSNVANTLDNILKPLDLIFRESSKGVYNISGYEYYRRTEAEGKKHLDELLGLYKNANEFNKRKKELRECILKELGISPNAKKTPLNPIVTSKITMDGYMVENIAFESVPGNFVAGTLYTPTKGKGPFPVILSPHGHFYNESSPSLAADSGRYRPDMQYRCATLAKMGAIVLSYDMYAWGESVLQTGAHSFHETGFALAMQTWNSIRGLDYLLSLPNTDKKRVGITGASGGGTQTILLAALDDRVTASVPVVMVSSSFYGGCPCESGLPIHDSCGGHKTNNAEIAAMIAPHPQLIVSDGDDWTKSVPGTDYPYLKKVYGFYGKEDNISQVYLPDDKHDYGFSKRVPMYTFFAKAFGLNIKAVTGKDGKIDERGCTIQKKPDLLVFGKKYPLPLPALRSHQEIVNAFDKVQGK